MRGVILIQTMSTAREIICADQKIQPQDRSLLDGGFVGAMRAGLTTPQHSSLGRGCRNDRVNFRNHDSAESVTTTMSIVCRDESLCAFSSCLILQETSCICA